ncbi:MAG: PQQ-dependent sugar dehydrogenase [Planctomycetes bacterium]|nr:PQQ-dependent sugar dehydrogenase [Planctomycetota bacterium]
MKRVVVIARGAVVALQLVLVVVAVLLASSAAPRFNITPLPHLKNAALSGADLATVLGVFLGWHLAGSLAALAWFRRPAFDDARRALAELYVVLIATSLASLHLFVLTIVPFSANFHAFVYLFAPALHVAAFAGFALHRPGAAPTLRARARQVPGRVKGLAASRWTALTCALVVSPGAMAVLYKKSGDFANLVNNIRVTLNHRGDSRWALAEAVPGLTLDQPMDVRFAPGRPTLMFVLERPGRLVRVDLDRDPAREVVLDIADEVGPATVENGALSFALHPEFGRDGSPNAGFVYVYYTHSRPDALNNRLARFDLSAADVGASRLLLVDQGRPPNGFHNGGSVFFDRDGLLYWSCGDFGARHAQRLDQGLGGGVFRIDVDRRGGDVSGPILRQPEDGATAHYFIPRSNPWAGSPDRLGEFLALGLRNPFRVSLDGDDLWVGDVGWDGWEEVTRLRPGDNGQWPYREGPVETIYPRPDEVIGREAPPVHAYAQTAVDRAVIGGVVYRGDRYPALRGRYVFADNNSGIVRALDPAHPERPPEALTRAPFLGQQGITSIHVAPDGSILFTVLGSKAAPSGALLRLGGADDAVTAAADPGPATGGVAGKYEAVCARCHGIDGRGEASLGAGVAPRPDFTDPAWQALRTDDELRRVVLEGGAAAGKSRDMPAWQGFFDDDEMDALIELIRGFSP